MSSRIWPPPQAAVDRFLCEYNTNRPHQALDMAFPADRFRPNTGGAALLPLKLPTILGMAAAASAEAVGMPGTEPVAAEPLGEPAPAAPAAPAVPVR